VLSPSPSLPPSLSLISPILLLFHFNNLFGCDLGNNSSFVNTSSLVERPPYHGDIFGGSSKANTSNHYTTSIIVLSIWVIFAFGWIIFECYTKRNDYMEFNDVD